MKHVLGTLCLPPLWKKLLPLALKLKENLVLITKNEELIFVFYN